MGLLKSKSILGWRTFPGKTSGTRSWRLPSSLLKKTTSIRRISTKTGRIKRMSNSNRTFSCSGETQSRLFSMGITSTTSLQPWLRTQASSTPLRWTTFRREENPQHQLRWFRYLDLNAQLQKEKSSKKIKVRVKPSSILGRHRLLRPFTGLPHSNTQVCNKVFMYVHMCLFVCLYL